MLNNTTINKLNEMRLNAMADNYTNQLHDSSFDPLSFEERFGMIVDLEWSRRKNNKLGRSSKNCIK